jgi:hypothetical protein
MRKLTLRSADGEPERDKDVQQKLDLKVMATSRKTRIFGDEVDQS